MNPITQTKNQNAMNLRELELGYTGTESSWHKQYKDSAWIFVGGLNYELTEGDVICVFSQYGEIANINLVRDKETGRSKGFAFVCYENQKSTILATDNLNGITLAGRIIRVDHVEKYKVPATGNVKVGRQDANQAPTGVADGEMPSLTDYVREHGCGPEAMKRIYELQKALKSSKSGPQSSGSRTEVKRSPSPPRRVAASPSHRASRNGDHRRSPTPESVSPPRRRNRSPNEHKFARGYGTPHLRNVSPPRKRDARQGDTSPRDVRRSPVYVSPPRNRRRSSPVNVSPPRNHFSRRRHSPNHRRGERHHKRPFPDVSLSRKRRSSPSPFGVSPPRSSKEPAHWNPSPKRVSPSRAKKSASPSPPRSRRDRQVSPPRRRVSVSPVDVSPPRNRPRQTSGSRRELSRSPRSLRR